MVRDDLRNLPTPPDKPWPRIENPPEPNTDDWWFLMARKQIHRARRRALQRSGEPGDYSDLD